MMVAYRLLGPEVAKKGNGYVGPKPFDRQQNRAPQPNG